jgi:glutaminase
VLRFEAGETILREGDPARLLFVVASGSATVWLRAEDGRPRRVACIGPGLTVGEMSLLDGGTRSADVIADERTLCYGLSVERLRELAVEHPNILVTILGNVTRYFSERLRRANREIQALE